MKPELARLLTTSLAQFLDANGKARMCLSNSECMALEKAFTKEKFDDVEAFACRKMTGQEKPQLTEFEKAVENVLCGVGVPGDDIFGYDNIHGTAHALLEIAKKELVHEMPMPEDSVLFNKGVQEGRRLVVNDAIRWLKDNASKYIINFTESYPDAPFKADISGRIYEDFRKEMEG